MSQEVAYKGRSYFFETVKAVVVAVITSLALILLAAFLIKIFNIDTKYISVINQIIKGVSILTAALICFRLPQNGWLRGIVLGIFYILFAFIVFSLLDGSFAISLCLINDLALGGVSGLISGIVAVNLRK